MKLAIIIISITLVAIIVFLVGCKGGGPKSEAEAAVARGEYQFIALLDPEGKWTYPQVPEIPEWYFQTTGTRIRQTTPASRDADIAYMTSYNDALYQTLKAQNKFHLILETVAKVKANLDKMKK